MKKIVALVACCATVATPIALADEGNPTAATQPSATESCTALKAVYAERRWRESKPARGESICPVRDHAGARRTVEHFYDYRAYRQITPYRCLRGREGTYAIPCSIISCESGYSWAAANPSGAVGPYQLLGWGAPYPARTFAQRLANHRIAATVYDGGRGRSNWVC